MSWIITKDYNPDMRCREGTNGNAKGVVGPNGTRRTTLQAFKVASNLKEFRMKDGDGEIYYEGLWVGDHGSDEMEPLDNFGQPNAGCTSIEYKDPKTGEWTEV